MKVHFLSLIAFVIAGTATAQNEPAPGEVRISEVSYEGSGCTPGSAADMVSPDGRAFTLFFSDFGITTEQHGVLRKQCRVAMTIEAPIGFEFALVGLDYRGYMDITKKAMLKFSSRMSFHNGNGGQKIFDFKVKGPLADEFFFPVRTGDQSKWSGCANRDRPMVLTTEAALQSATGPGSLVTLDSMDGEFSQRYQLQWRRCR